MRHLTIIFFTISLFGCLEPALTSDNLIAAKCRLKLPIKKEECERVGVYGTQGGRMPGLPVTEIENK